MKKGVGYIRVSKSKQEESPEAQMEKIKNYCNLHNIELLFILYDEDISGDVPICERPAGKDIEKWIEQGATEIIAAKLDRMFRTTIGALTQIELWVERKIAVHIVNLQGISIDTSTVNGKFFLTLMSAVAEMELGMIRERTQDVMDKKRAASDFLGTVPFGYERYDFTIDAEGIKRGGKVRPLPTRSAAIRDIKDMYNAKLSTRYIAKAIKEDYGIDCTATTICNIAKGEPDEQPNLI